jgi:hypothetical protein
VREISTNNIAKGRDGYKTVVRKKTIRFLRTSKKLARLSSSL